MEGSGGVCMWAWGDGRDPWRTSPKSEQMEIESPLFVFHLKCGLLLDFPSQRLCFIVCSLGLLFFVLVPRFITSLLRSALSHFCVCFLNDSSQTELRIRGILFPRCCVNYPYKTDCFVDSKLSHE